MRKAVSRGLCPEAALRALTVTPAELFGVANRLGTLEKGKAAHVVVVEGDLFDKKGKIVETWVDGRRYETSTAPPADVRGTWIATLASGDGKTQTIEIKLAGEPGKLSGTLHKDEKEAKLQSVTLNQTQLGGDVQGRCARLGRRAAIQRHGLAGGGAAGLVVGDAGVGRWQLDAAGGPPG